MQTRASHTIAIKRNASSPVTVATVPITDDCVRRFKIMEEDCVVIEFDSASVISYNGTNGFLIGDWIEDAMFGKFLIIDEQTPPEYNTESGIYRYELRFEREYVSWKNKVFMLTYDDENGDIVRKECDWKLTENLAGHLAEMLRNLSALGYSYSVVSSELEEYKTTVLMEYNGASIFASLNELARSYNCEWWVEGTVIHFGKYEQGTVVPLRLGYNVNQVTANKNTSEYANRIIPFGSTKNIPATYRKKPIFTVSQKSGSYFKESNGLSADSFFPRYFEINESNVGHYLYPGHTKNWILFDTGRPASVVYGSNEWYDVKFSFDLCFLGQVPDSSIASSFALEIVDYYASSLQPASTIYSLSEELEFTRSELFPPGKPIYREFRIEGSATINLKDRGGFYIRATFTNFDIMLSLPSDYWEARFPLGFGIRLRPTIENGAIFSVKTKNTPVKSTLLWNDNEYAITFNGSPVEAGTGKDLFVFDNGIPTGFGVGENFEIVNGDFVLNPAKVPISAFVGLITETLNSVKLLGEQRLLLPEGVPFIGDDTLDASQVVEKVVVFDDIYPRCALRVMSITEEEKTITTTSADGSTKTETFTQYIIKAKRISGSDNVPFLFSSEYLTPEKLQVRFLTPDEEAERTGGSSYGDTTNGYLLAGMTFDVAYTDDDETYTIVWNSDYGATLPNSTLRPTVFDPFILIGWNTRAIENLDLVGDAELELQAAAEAYLESIEDEQFTFNCTMISKWIFDNGLLPAGQRVAIYHDALRNEKITRIIGYELNLANPFDSPQYTIGETEAFSRIRALERKTSTQTQGSVSGQASGSVGFAGISNFAKEMYDAVYKTGYIGSNLMGSIPVSFINLLADYGVTFNEETGYFSLGNLSDLTYNEMRSIYAHKQPVWCDHMFYSNNTDRTVLPFAGASLNTECFYSCHSLVEVPALMSNTYPWILCHSSFRNCPNLKRIDAAIYGDFSLIGFNTFKNLPLLEFVNIQFLNADLDLSECPSLTTACVAFIVSHAKSDNDITILLDSDVYDAAIQDSDVIDALSNKQNVSLASA